MIEPKINEVFKDKWNEILCLKSSEIKCFSDCSQVCCFSHSGIKLNKVTYRLFCSKCHLSCRTDITNVCFVVYKTLSNSIYDRKKT